MIEVGKLKRAIQGRRPTREEANYLYKLYPKETLIRLNLEGIPHCLEDDWAKWERCRGIIAKTVNANLGIQINPIDIRLIGSRNIGWKFKTSQSYDEKSDWDWLIINNELYRVVQEDAEQYWEEYALKNKNAGKAMKTYVEWIRRGFIQTDHIPMKCSILNTVRDIKKLLEVELNSKKQDVTFRIYRDYESAMRQWSKSFKVRKK